MRVVVRAGDALTWAGPEIRPIPIVKIEPSEPETVLAARKQLAERYAARSERAATRLDLIKEAPSAVDALRRLYADGE